MSWSAVIVFLYWLSAQRTVPFTLTWLRYAVQSRLWCWTEDFVFPFSSPEPFAIGCIDINSLYASPVCRLCVCERQCVHVCVCRKEHTCVFIAAAAVNWSIVCFSVRRMCTCVKIATRHASTVSTHQQKHKSAPLQPSVCVCWVCVWLICYEAIQCPLGVTANLKIW